MTGSEELFQRAAHAIPGGVNSPVRAFGAVGGVPRFAVRGDGAYLEDTDGRRSVDQVRLVSSGTEAAMSAIRLARGATGRDTLIKLEGCYHGHSDALLARGAGSGLATFSIPSTPGVTAGAARDTLIAPFNDLDEVESLFEASEGTVAALIVVPVA